MAKTRIYLVKDENTEVRLVKASTPSAAINYVVGDRYGAKPATQDEIAQLVGEGWKIEVAAKAAA